MRFFGSRSRTNSPMLPVKTPKVPNTVSKKDKENNGGIGGNSEGKKNGNTSKTGGVNIEKEKEGQIKHKPSLTETELQQTTKINNKFLSKMKRYILNVFLIPFGKVKCSIIK